MTGWALLIVAGLLAVAGVACAVSKPPARPRVCPCPGCARQRWADARARTTDVAWCDIVRNFQEEGWPAWGSRPCGCARARYADGTYEYILCRDCDQEMSW